MKDAVVITGLGVIGPFGVGSEALAAALVEGTASVPAIDRSRGFHLPQSARSAGLIDPNGIKAWLDPKTSRRMSLPSRLAVAASRMAFRDAGIERESLRGQPAAVSLGTAFGPTGFSVQILDQIRKKGPESVSPFLFMESVANVHAGQVALDSGLIGSNATITQREAGTLLAVAQAYAYVAAGAAPSAVSGGVEELAPLAHAVLDRFHALSRGRGDAEQGRPFDLDRDGFVASEGAATVVLERAASAQARGARVRAILSAAVRASDPTATAQNWGHGSEALAHTLQQGLARHGIAPASIDRVVSGASGSRTGDLLEARVLRAVFGAQLPPVLTPKAVTGEYGGGLLGAAVLAVDDDARWPTPSFEKLDPECGIRPHDGRALPPACRVLVSALAAGGPACWLVLDAPPRAKADSTREQGQAQQGDAS